jgi:hypothetical protein
MNCRWLLNLGLLVLAGVLVLLVIYEPGKQPAVITPLTTLTPDNIQRINIDNKASGSIRLQKRNGTWYLLEPYQVPANRLRMDGLLSLAETRSFAAFTVNESELDKYGLDKPKGSIQLNDVTIYFGDTEEVNKRRYVRINDMVHLIADTFYHQIITDATSFASTELLPPGSQPKIINLGNLVLRRQDDGSWDLQPDQVASADQINQLVQAWQQAAGVYVKPASDKEAIRDIKIELADGQSIAFQVLQGDDFILRRQNLPLQYHMVEAQRQQLLTLPSAASTTDNTTPAE